MKIEEITEQLVAAKEGAQQLRLWPLEEKDTETQPALLCCRGMLLREVLLATKPLAKRVSADAKQFRCCDLIVSTVVHGQVNDMLFQFQAEQLENLPRSSTTQLGKRTLDAFAKLNR